MKSQIKIEPSIMTYLHITPELKGFSDADIKDLRNNIVLLAQGDAVVIKDDLDPSLYPFIVSMLYSSVRELVMTLSTGQIVALWSHVDPKLYFRPDGIITSISDTITRIKEREHAQSKDKKIDIDIEQIWAEKKLHGDIIDATHSFLKKFSKMLAHAQIIEIVGTIPALPLSCAIYLSRSFGKEIYFNSEKTGKIKLF